jgi:hypothetical protein
VEHDAGLDVFLELSGVCIVDDRGTIISEAKVTSDVAAPADHGQKQGTSGRINRGSVTKGPIIEADIDEMPFPIGFGVLGSAPCRSRKPSC